MARSSDWRKNNPEKWQAWLDANKERHRQKRKKWYEKQPKEALAARCRDYYQSERGWKLAALRRYKKRAKENGLEFNLTIDDIHIPAKCPVLGFPLVIGGRLRSQIWNSPSLDRCDNTMGYVKGNVRVISHRANGLKSDATLDEIRRVARYMRRTIVLKTTT